MSGKKKRKRIPKNCFKVNKKSAAQTLAAESTLFFHLLDLVQLVGLTFFVLLLRFVSSKWYIILGLQQICDCARRFKHNLKCVPKPPYYTLLSALRRIMISWIAIVTQKSLIHFKINLGVQLNLQNKTGKCLKKGIFQKPVTFLYKFEYEIINSVLL